VSSAEHLVGDVRSAAESATGSVRQAWRLPSTERSVHGLRQDLRVVLDDTGLSPDDLYDLLVAACEAATNAIEHAQQPSEPFVDVLFDVTDDQVTIVVRDHGRWRHGPSGPHRGRGLQMMRTLAETTITSDPQGTTVTLCRPATGVGRGA
jgi:anti-sigma regulatory factor (Ser/Thr protein kinase)